ncbi:glycosyltransferase family 2 protein [soil metagenome]
MNISVCMATHNGEKYLRHQVDSILAQLDSSDELVISDDNSEDFTLSILKSFHDPRIKLLSPEKFGTPVRNFEYALQHCVHPLIFLADQDDVWHPEKVRIMRDALRSNDLVICDCRIVNEELYPLHGSFFQVNRSKSGLFRNLFKNSFIGCCMAFRREVLEKALPFPENIALHDQWIGLVAERYFNVKFMSQILVDHRRHSGNYSTTTGASENSFGRKIKLRFHLAKDLLEH